MRWGFIKKEFTKAYLQTGGTEQRLNASREAKRERGIWQRKFWEHTIRDEKDFEMHMDYIHFNPVKHGLVSCPKEYAYSTFHKYVELGVYDVDWGCGVDLDFGDLSEVVGE